jgi:hypothetical protein
MTNNNAFKAILDSLPLKPARSKLEPYAKLILELHRRGRTYREIARILTERCDIQTSRSTVNDFVRAQSKRPQNSRKIEKIEQPKIRPHKSVLLMPAEIPPETALATDGIQKRIADLKSRPIPGTENNPKIFHYDPEQPLQLPSRSQKKGSDQWR